MLAADRFRTQLRLVRILIRLLASCIGRSRTGEGRGTVEGLDLGPWFEYLSEEIAGHGGWSVKTSRSLALVFIHGVGSNWKGLTTEQPQAFPQPLQIRASKAGNG